MNGMLAMETLTPNRSTACDCGTGGAGCRDLRRRGRPLLRGDQFRRGTVGFAGSWNVESPSLGRIEQAADVVRRMLQDGPVGHRPGSDGHAIERCGWIKVWRWRAQRQGIARLTDVTAGESSGLPPATGPTIKDV